MITNKNEFGKLRPGVFKAFKNLGPELTAFIAKWLANLKRLIQSMQVL